MRCSISGLAVAFALIAAPANAADPLRCSSFLHAADGSWRSVAEGAVLGPNGVVHVDMGEVLRPTAKGPKGDIARALNGLCEGS